SRRSPRRVRGVAGSGIRRTLNTAVREAQGPSRVQVDLQEYVRDGYWRAVKHKDSGWTRCSGRYTTPGLTCVHDGEKETYNTQVTLQVEYHGRFSEPGIADTGNTVIDC
ncbi:hypothetical protein, partial [Streptomyces sp. NPDC001435]|uniref:hypothetical protein n=1 Tax=Streptomyces sp. NPDC001435 TaxID=3364576 RepID=UPI0036BE70F6